MIRIFEINGFGVPQSTQAAVQRGDLSVLSDWKADDWGSLIQWIASRVYSPRFPNVPLTLAGQPVSAAVHRWIPEAAAANLLQQMTPPDQHKGCWWDATGRLALPDNSDQCAKLLLAFTKIMADVEAHANVFAAWGEVRQAIAARAPILKTKPPMLNRINRLGRALDDGDLALWNETWLTMTSRSTASTLREEYAWQELRCEIKKKDADAMAPWYAVMAAHCAPLWWWDTVAQTTSVSHLVAMLEATPSDHWTLRAPHKPVPLGALVTALRAFPKNTEENERESSQRVIAWLRGRPERCRGLFSGSLPIGSDAILRRVSIEKLSDRLTHFLLYNGSWHGVLAHGPLASLVSDWQPLCAALSSAVPSERISVASTMLSGKQSAAAWAHWTDSGLVNAVAAVLSAALDVRWKTAAGLDKQWSEWATDGPLPWFDQLPQGLRAKLPITTAARAAHSAALSLRRPQPR